MIILNQCVTCVNDIDHYNPIQVCDIAVTLAEIMTVSDLGVIFMLIISNPFRVCDIGLTWTSVILFESAWNPLIMLFLQRKFRK